MRCALRFSSSYAHGGLITLRKIWRWNISDARYGHSYKSVLSLLNDSRCLKIEFPRAPWKFISTQSIRNQNLFLSLYFPNSTPSQYSTSIWRHARVCILLYRNSHLVALSFLYSFHSRSFNKQPVILVLRRWQGFLIRDLQPTSWRIRIQHIHESCFERWFQKLCWISSNVRSKFCIARNFFYFHFATDLRRMSDNRFIH